LKIIHMAKSNSARSRVSENPYASPEVRHYEPQPAPRSHNQLATIGVALSAIGVFSLFVSPLFDLDVRRQPSLTYVIYFFCCFILAGLLTSAAALFRAPKRLAVLGMMLGAFGCLYLPTLSISIALQLRD
jgi:hypothetical protein